MDIVKKEYQKAYKKYGKAKESLFIPKGRQKERFELLTNHIHEENFSILDFGCGFGDLREFLKNKYTDFSYMGVDMVDDFIRENKKVSVNEFMLINNVDDVVEKYKYISISGAFNMSYFENDLESHELKVYDVLQKLFEENLKDNGVLSVDFMSDEVDYIQDGAYHVNVAKMYDFLSKNLSRRVSFDKSVFPYEITFKIFKNQNINRESSLYAN